MAPGPEEFDELRARVAGYYSQKLAEHGASPRGADWNDAAGQELRFEKLLQMVDRRAKYSLNDLGCGYGALIAHLDQRGDSFDYVGCDVSEAMIAEGRAAFAGRSDVRFVSTAGELPSADYSVASGIFNVKVDAPDQTWQAYVLATLEELDRRSRLGFAFNALTSYSDEEKRQARLYYADPCFYFDHCKRRFSKRVALLHDYQLWEFTILVRK